MRITLKSYFPRVQKYLKSPIAERIASVKAKYPAPRDYHLGEYEDAFIPGSTGNAKEYVKLAADVMKEDRAKTRRVRNSNLIRLSNYSHYRIKTYDRKVAKITKRDRYMSSRIVAAEKKIIKPNSGGNEIEYSKRKLRMRYPKKDIITINQEHKPDYFISKTVDIGKARIRQNDDFTDSRLRAFNSGDLFERPYPGKTKPYSKNINIEQYHKELFRRRGKKLNKADSSRLENKYRELLGLNENKGYNTKDFQIKRGLVVPPKGKDNDLNSLMRKFPAWKPTHQNRHTYKWTLGFENSPKNRGYKSKPGIRHMKHTDIFSK